MIDNNFSWILGGNFEMKSKESSNFYEGLYQNTFKDFVSILKNE